MLVIVIEHLTVLRSRTAIGSSLVSVHFTTSNRLEGFGDENGFYLQRRRNRRLAREKRRREKLPMPHRDEKRRERKRRETPTIRRRCTRPPFRRTSTVRGAPSPPRTGWYDSFPPLPSSHSLSSPSFSIFFLTIFFDLSFISCSFSL